VVVNGKRCRAAWLLTGDVMTFGVARLTVEQQRADGVVVLRLNDPHALNTKKAGAANDLSLKEPVSTPPLVMVARDRCALHRISLAVRGSHHRPAARGTARGAAAAE